jgi:hypothetical protein
MNFLGSHHEHGYELTDFTDVGGSEQLQQNSVTWLHPEELHGL